MDSSNGYRMGGLCWAAAIAAWLPAPTLSGQEASAPAAPAASVGQAPAAPAEHLGSWEMPAIRVVGTRGSDLPEEDLIGTYAQPRWTATRRFLTTRVYVVPEGKVEAEFWLRTTFEKDGTTAYRSLYEVEFGLPHRFQLDVYLRTDHTSDSGKVFLSQQLELRYALADWGRLPGNPTLYFEWIRHDPRDGPDQIEPKLLLGGEIRPRWHWAVNFVAECETAGDREREYSVRSGLSYAVRDSRFSLGAECQANFTDTKLDRGSFEKSVVLGPSLQFRPVPQFTVNLAPLFGITPDSPDAQIWLNGGWEF